MSLRCYPFWQNHQGMAVLFAQQFPCQESQSAFNRHPSGSRNRALQQAENARHLSAAGSNI